MSPPDNDSRPSELANLAEPAVGETIGPYRLLRKLGEGTAGKVFEVEHLRIGRRAAMKILHPDTDAPGLVTRLFTEAQAVNLIGNPHVVEIVDILEPTDGQPFHALVMELLQGTPLADLLARQEPLAVERLLPIMAQVCGALAAVHAAGFVHRDLKPENVFLVRREGEDGFVKLLDFGLVKETRADAHSPKATIEGTFLGSPAYASPEQAAGKPVDFRTDIYAAGVMLHELATGRLPFDAQSIGDLLIKQISQPAPHLPEPLLSTDVGRALDAIIQTCMAKDPEQRKLSAAELAAAFEDLASGPAGAARVLLRSLQRPRRARSRPVVAPIHVAAALALAVLGGWLGTRTAPRRAPFGAGTGQAAAAGLLAPTSSTSVAAAERACPAGLVKAEPRKVASARRALPARVRAKIDSTVTLDPYR